MPLRPQYFCSLPRAFVNSQMNFQFSTTSPIPIYSCKRDHKRKNRYCINVERPVKIQIENQNFCNIRRQTNQWKQTLTVSKEANSRTLDIHAKRTIRSLAITTKSFKDLSNVIFTVLISTYRFSFPKKMSEENSNPFIVVQSRSHNFGFKIYHP